MGLFPMFMRLEGRACLVVGAGSVAEGKIRSLLDAGASVRVVAPQANTIVATWAHANLITWEAREFAPLNLEGIFLVVSATSSKVVNENVFQEAHRKNVLCNVVDDPEHCDFYYPAVVQRGELQIAISTGGHSPALAQRLRKELEEQYGPEYAAWVNELGRARQELFARDMDAEKRRELLHLLAAQQPFAAQPEQNRVEEKINAR